MPTFLSGLDSATTALIAVHCFIAGVTLAIFSQHSRLSRGLAVLITALAANLVVFIFIDTGTGRRSATIATTLILSGWLISQSHYLARGCSFATKKLSHPLIISLAFCTFGVACLFWSDAKSEQELDVTELRQSIEGKLMPEDLVEAVEVVAETDRGHRVRLWKLHQEAEERFAARPDNENGEPGRRIVITKGVSPGNCHGWVFMNGGYFIFGESVQQILDDNGYSRVEKPGANDLIVYLDKERRITHTGIVRGLMRDGRAIVESKWSVAGRYIHFADESIYGTDYSFYHADRSTALLKIVVSSNSKPAR